MTPDPNFGRLPARDSLNKRARFCKLVHWSCLKNEAEWEEETMEQETEPGRSHSYATRHDELLSFGNPARGFASRSAFEWSGSPLFERGSGRRTWNLNNIRKIKVWNRDVHARVIYIMVQLAAVLSLLRKSKSFLRWHLHLFHLSQIDCRFVLFPSDLFYWSAWINERNFVFLRLWILNDIIAR